MRQEAAKMPCGESVTWLGGIGITLSLREAVGP